MTELIFICEIPILGSRVFNACQEHPELRIRALSNRLERCEALCESWPADVLVVATQKRLLQIEEPDIPLLVLSDNLILRALCRWYSVPRLSTQTPVWMILEEILALRGSGLPQRPRPTNLDPSCRRNLTG